MNIVELQSFDIATASPWHMLSTSGFWAALPRLCQGLPTARVLMVADSLQPSDVMRGFQNTAADETTLPPGLRAYRMQYSEYLNRAVEEVRFIRLFLVVNTLLDDQGLCNLLGTYSLTARPLDREIPMPFHYGQDTWNHVATENGMRWGLLRSKATQYGAIYPRALHRLFALDYPIWAAMHVGAYAEMDALKLLNYKAAVAKYEPRQSLETAQQATEIEGAIGRLRGEMNRAGAALHTLRFYVMVGGLDDKDLHTRLEVARGALPFAMQRVNPPGATARKVFGVHPLDELEGTPCTSPGVALLTGSALSYRRRTETNGVLLGVDRNQAPVILNIFDPRNPSYNMAVLGQTGSGKTFAVLLLMLRHLLLGCHLIIVDPQGNVDLSFLGEDLYHRAVMGTGAAAVNILDITHDEISNQVESVCAMLALLGVYDRQDALARAVLDQVLLDIYEPLWGRQIRHMPTLGAVQARLRQLTGDVSALPMVREGAASLAFKLTPYAEGSYADLFGRATSVDFSLSRAVTVYDVSRLPKQELGGNLRAALLSILVSDINQAIRRKRQTGDTTPILFFVDEMGMLMRDGVIAAHVSGEYKTARARRVGMIVADQDLHSLLGPADASGLHHGAPILANSAFTLLFYQRDSERQRIQETFSGLPEMLAEALYSLPRGVCLAQMPGDLLLVHVKPSAFEQVILSSQLQDRQRAREVVQRMVKELAQ